MEQLKVITILHRKGEKSKNRFNSYPNRFTRHVANSVIADLRDHDISPWAIFLGWLWIFFYRCKECDSLQK